MARLLLLLIIAFALDCKAQDNSEAASDFVDYVNTLVGTQSSHALSNGNTYPAVAMPWGMNAWTPQTGKRGDGWAYTYDAQLIRGIKQTHQPSPWINDYAQFALMPVTGKPVFDEDQRASHFSHKAEVATPYYYKVYLADHNVTAELAPTERAAVMRFTYHDDSPAYLVIDAMDDNAVLEVDTLKGIVTGYTTNNSGGVPDNFRNYFVINITPPQPSPPPGLLVRKQGEGAFKSVLTVEEANAQPTNSNFNTPSPLRERAGVRMCRGAVVLGFNTKHGDQVTACIASSFISVEQAWRNLAELNAPTNAQQHSNNFRSLEQVAAAGHARWNEVLSRINILQPTNTNFNTPSPLRERAGVRMAETFYSCLYRSLLFPRSFYEIGADGKPIHYSPYDGQLHEGYMFTDTGFWDTFRALLPLINLVYPSTAAKIQEGLVNAYRESGFLPEWASPGHRNCMIGNNSASVVADAYIKGIRIRDIDTLWQAVVHGANAVHPTVPSTGRLGYRHYNRLGYVPCDVGINESAARTLEYAYDDWCIMQLGRALGKSDSVLAPYAQRAQNYRNVFDPEHKLMRGRNADGSFQSPYNPFKWGDAFTEGNAWHYTWSVFHDPEGLMELMGGRECFAQMLDSVFTLPPVFDESYYGFVIHEIREMQIMGMGNYAHGNQPIQHMIYLYNWAGEPWKTQYWTREVMNRLYTPNPDGYCGDEDNGQTSAWYVFSALGFYPVCPASDEYALGAPIFPHATITLENGHRVTINAPLTSDKNRYVDTLLLNNSPHPLTVIRHSELATGATLDFKMTDLNGKD